MARMASILAHTIGVIELPLSHTAHVWVISPTHIYNSGIVGPKWLMLLDLEVSCNLGALVTVRPMCDNTLIETHQNKVSEF
jgi:hypothetical protein